MLNSVTEVCVRQHCRRFTVTIKLHSKRNISLVTREGNKYKSVELPPIKVALKSSEVSPVLHTGDW